MDALSAIFSFIFLIVVVYGVSRLAHFMKDTREKLNDLEKKIDELKKITEEKQD